MLKKILSLTISITMIASLCASALGADTTVAIGMENIEVIDIEFGTMYVEQTDDYKLVYTIYDTGFINYAISKTENPTNVLSGKIVNSSDFVASKYSNTLSINNLNSHNEIKKFAMDQSKTAHSSAWINIESKSSGMQKGFPGSISIMKRDIQRNTNYKSPMSTTRLASLSKFGVRADLYENVELDVYELTHFQYYAGDMVEAVLAGLYTHISTGKLIKSFATTASALSGLVFEYDGSAVIYRAENPGMKWVKINNGLWHEVYNDYTFDGLYGESVVIEEKRHITNSYDYYNSRSYHLNKALDLYEDFYS